LKTKGERKSLRIALDLLVQVPDLHAVEFREVGVEDNSLPAQNEAFSNQLFLRLQALSSPYVEARFKLEITNCDLKI